MLKCLGAPFPNKMKMSSPRMKYDIVKPNTLSCDIIQTKATFFH